MPTFFDAHEHDGVRPGSGRSWWERFDFSAGHEEVIHKNAIDPDLLGWDVVRNEKYGPPRFQCDECGSRESPILRKTRGPARRIRGTILEYDEDVMCRECWWERFGEQLELLESLTGNQWRLDGGGDGVPQIEGTDK